MHHRIGVSYEKQMGFFVVLFFVFDSCSVVVVVGVLLFVLPVRYPAIWNAFPLSGLLLPGRVHIGSPAM